MRGKVEFIYSPHFLGNFYSKTKVSIEMQEKEYVGIDFQTEKNKKML